MNMLDAMPRLSLGMDPMYEASKLQQLGIQVRAQNMLVEQ